MTSATDEARGRDLSRLSRTVELKQLVRFYEDDMNARFDAMRRKFFVNCGRIYFGHEDEPARLVAVPEPKAAQKIADDLNRALDPIRAGEKLAAHFASRKFQADFERLAELAAFEARNRLSSITIPQTRSVPVVRDVESGAKIEPPERLMVAESEPEAAANGGVEAAAPVSAQQEAMAAAQQQAAVVTPPIDKTAEAPAGVEYYSQMPVGQREIHAMHSGHYIHLPAANGGAEARNETSGEPEAQVEIGGNPNVAAVEQDQGEQEPAQAS